MFKVARGANRTVLLVGRWAFKFPSCRSWRDFLYGLLNNMTEGELGCRGDPILCPVLLNVWGGLCVVMRRVEPLDDLEGVDLDPWRVYHVEPKPNSYGRLRGRVVAVDYGWPPI